MRELGWVEGHTIAVDVRPAAGDYNRLVMDAGELIESGVDLVVAMGTPGVTAVQQHSRTIPVVFTLVADPVSQGLIGNLAHPGGNMTGFTNFEFAIAGKWIQLLKEIDHNITTLTLLSNPANASFRRFVEVLEEAGRTKGLMIIIASLRTVSDIERAITTAARQANNALIVFPDSLLILHRTLIVDLAEHYRLPAIFPFRVFPESGGLMSYGIDYVDVYRQAANYADRILKGTKPADLPVQAPNKYDLVINLKTAKALGLDVPAILLAIADEVIE
jgi:putative ABC transport system substrate-binding protein